MPDQALPQSPAETLDVDVARRRVEHALSLVVVTIPEEVAPALQTGLVDTTVAVDVIDVISGTAMTEIGESENDVDVAQALIEEAFRHQPDMPINFDQAA